MSVGVKKSVQVQDGALIFRQNLKDCLAEKVLCDVVLVSKIDSKRVPAHRIVLAAGSEYFRTMFVGNMKESKEKEITFEMPGNVLEALVKYFYSDVIELDEVYAKELYAAAHMMHLGKVITECFDFLLNNLNSTNCFELLRFAELHEYALLHEKTQNFILKEFETIYKSTGFLQVSFDSLRNLVKQDNLNLRDEKVIFLAVQRWISYNKDTREMHKDTLMEHVNLTFLKPEFLYDFVKPFCNTEKTKEAFFNAVQYHLLPNRRHKMNITKSRYNSINTLFAVGFNRKKTLFLQIEAFDSHTNKWYKLNTNIPWRQNFGLTAMGESLIILGGKENDDALNTVVSLDLKSLNWKYLPPMNKNLNFCSAVVCNGHLYALGWHLNTSVIERFDPATNKWTTFLVNSYKACTFTALKDRIYTAGLNSNNVLELKRLDLQTNNMVAFKAFQSNIKLACMSEFNGQLYLFDPNRRAYRFNFDGSFTELRQMPNDVTWFLHPAIFDNEIFVGQCSDNSLLKYNAVTNDWTKMPPFNDKFLSSVTSCKFYWNRSKIIQE